MLRIALRVRLRIVLRCSAQDDSKTLPARDSKTLPARVILSEAELRSSAECARRDLGLDGCAHEASLCVRGGAP